MEFKKAIEEAFKEVKGLNDQGEKTSYIPELAKVDSKNFGVFLSTIDGQQYGVGDFNTKFSIQSIAKVLSLSLAYQILGVSIWDRLGVEPSGTPFNSLVQLESDQGIPRNPFINAGAIVISDILLTNLNNPKEDFLKFVQEISNNPSLRYSDAVAASGKSVGFRNTALCNFIKSFGNIDNEPSQVLDFYFALCSLEMTCKELSEAFLFLANNGQTTFGNQSVLAKNQSKRVNALMQTCGFYDESGEFAFKVGLPGKSGVGGGIIAIHPNLYSIAVWSPNLNEKGNSYKGMKFLEAFTTKTETSIF